MPKLAHPEPPVNHSETARLRTISRWLHDLGRAPNNSDLEQLLDILRVLGPLDRKSAARRLQEVALEIQELRDCVTAAADGHPELSERYLAGGGARPAARGGRLGASAAL